MLSRYPHPLRHLFGRLIITSLVVSTLAPLACGATSVPSSVYRWAEATQPLLRACASVWQNGSAHYGAASGPYQVGESYATVIDQTCRSLPAPPAHSLPTSVFHNLAVNENRWYFDVQTGDTAHYAGDFAAVSRALPALRHALGLILSGRSVPTPTTRQSHVVVSRPESGLVRVAWTAPSGVVRSYEIVLVTPTQFAHYQRTGNVAPAVDITGLSPDTRHYVVTTIPKSGTYYVILWAHVGASVVVTPTNYPHLYLTTGTSTTTTTVPVQGRPYFMPTTIYWDSATTATVTFKPTPAAITTISKALADANAAAIGTGQVYAVRLGIHATTNGGSPATCVLVGSNTSTWLFPQVYFCRNLQTSLAAAAEYTLQTPQGLVSPHKVTFTTVTSNDNLG